MMQILGTALYLASAAAIVAGGLVWVRDRMRARAGGSRRPDELSPVDATALGLLAAAALGAFGVGIGAGRAADWSSLVFIAAVVALAARCVVFLFERSGRHTRPWVVVVPAVVVGALLAAAG